MHWSCVCTEGFCFGKEDENGLYPCGRDVPSPFCLGSGKSGTCPHFAWSGATERDVACFVPFRLIFWDKMKIWADRAYWRLRWWFWDQLWFNRRKVDEFLNSIPVVTAEDSPMVAEWEEEEHENQKKFEDWFPKAKEEW